MKILVSNDDGVEAPGIWALVRAVKGLGDVTVVAPADNQSGVGAGLSFRRSVQINEHESKEAGVACYAVGGTPADSVAFGVKHVFNDDVDAVVSGVNVGNNNSRNLLISGTIGASIVAAGLGIKTCAFSMDFEDEPGHPVIGKAITAISHELIDPSTPAGALFNVNFPSTQASSLQSSALRLTAQQEIGIQGVEGCAPTRSDFKMMLIPHDDGGQELFSGLKVNIDGLELTPGTDLDVLRRGRIAISALDGNTLVHDPNDPTLRRMIAAVERVIG